MIRRTTHYFLLAMLVLTGLAGRMHQSTLSSKDRRLLLAELQSSRAALLQSLNGISDRQANYQLEGVSLRHCTARLAKLEDDLIARFEQAMAVEPTEKRIGERQAINELNAEKTLKVLPPFTHSSFTGAVRCYKKGSSSLIVFARNTTDRVKGHFAPGSDVDAYQTLCLTGKYTRFYT